jgi:hypothetical protein
MAVELKVDVSAADATALLRAAAAMRGSAALLSRMADEAYERGDLLRYVQACECAFNNARVGQELMHMGLRFEGAGEG